MERVLRKQRKQALVLHLSLLTLIDRQMNCTTWSPATVVGLVRFAVRAGSARHAKTLIFAVCATLSFALLGSITLRGTHLLVFLRRRTDA